MPYKGLVANKAQRMHESLFDEIDRKMPFPGTVFSEVDEASFTHPAGSIRTFREPDEQLDEIHVERARYLLNTDDALFEMHS